MRRRIKKKYNSLAQARERAGSEEKKAARNVNNIKLANWNCNPWPLKEIIVMAKSQATNETKWGDGMALR